MKKSSTSTSHQTTEKTQLHPDAPLSACAIEQHADSLTRAAKAEVPLELRHIDWLADLSPYKREWIERSKKPLASHINAPLLPDWEASAATPSRRALLPAAAARVKYRGHDMTPYDIVGGHDDREFYSDTRYPWGCVCRIVRDGRFAGSGVIVGPRHVLTASHVVAWGKSKGVVEVCRDGGNARAITPIVSAMAYTKVESGSNFLTQYDEMDEDYAVFITADRIGERFGALGVRTYNSGWDGRALWHNVAYTSDRSDVSRPLWQGSRYLDEMPFDEGSARAMSTNADAWFGMSGSPMFGHWTTGEHPGWYVVAVLTSGNDWPIFGPSNYCAGGGLLTELVKVARQRYQ
jgi:V8-like Glu-specific endopeptidase